MGSCILYWLLKQYSSMCFCKFSPKKRSCVRTLIFIHLFKLSRKKYYFVQEEKLHVYVKTFPTANYLMLLFYKVYAGKNVHYFWGLHFLTEIRTTVHKYFTPYSETLKKIRLLWYLITDTLLFPLIPKLPVFLPIKFMLIIHENEWNSCNIQLISAVSKLYRPFQTNRKIYVTETPH